ncbi:MAG TPA: lipoate--protein ligase family protein [Gemmataceae bacterium]|nr:lipoate--protein ligase family protein [Gemmataceae bacterium]
MNWLDRTLPTLVENLALDEALLVEADAGRGGEVLRFWEWPTLAVVLGAGCRLADDVDEAACERDHVPIARRSSGGGTILQGAGCLSYTLVLAYERDPLLHDVRGSYRFILERVRRALTGLLPDIEHAGISDLASGGRKFSGNAQQRKRHFLLHHGTLLQSFDINQVGRYLRVPHVQPAYRQQRPHTDFMQNLPVWAADLKRRLGTAWHAQAEAVDWPHETIRQLVAEKYARPEWIRRR